MRQMMPTRRRPTWADPLPLCVLCALCALPIAPVLAGEAGGYLYLPPSLADSVVLYHSFSRAVDQPEICLLEGAKFRARGGRLAAGLTGQGFATSAPPEKSAGLELSQMAWPLTRPITVGLWYRLEEPMKAETGFGLLGLRGERGWISNFVAGRGPWCALTRPTFVVQLYRFDGISNVNGIHYGDGWVSDKQWHHAAVTVSEGSRVRIYWDGGLRSDFTTKGRLFRPADAVRQIGFGPGSVTPPMVVDELLVLGRALSAEEVRLYVESVNRLAEVGFPFRQAPRTSS